MSSDACCLLKTINSIEERLRSVFEWGLIAEFTSGPGDEVSILQRKRRTTGFALPDDVAEYIAPGPQSNVRELESRCLTRPDGRTLR